MNISIEVLIAIIPIILSGIALYFSIRKQDKEGKNIDADTISKLLKTIREQKEAYDVAIKKFGEERKQVKKEYEKRYNKLKEEFEDYKRVMTEQITELANETARVRAWANKLCEQLKNAGIAPHKFE